MTIGEQPQETVIVPDIHQNFRFLEEIRNQYDLRKATQVIFLGDFFDAKDPNFQSNEALEKTLLNVIELVNDPEIEIKLLLGNHDVAYFFSNSSKNARTPFDVRQLIHSYYGMPDRRKLKIIRDIGFDELWSEFDVSYVCQNYLFSHAGVALEYWDADLSTTENVARINRALVDPYADGSKIELSPLLKAGFSRGGDLPLGGPLWLDWNQEFGDELDLPQIVGHTVGADTRQLGRSYCLDAKQSCFGILKEGNLDIVTLES